MSKQIKYVIKKDAQFVEVFKKMPAIYPEYIIFLRYKRDDSVFYDTAKIRVQSSNLYEELNNVLEGKKEECYLACGMQDVNIRHRGQEIEIMHSPYEGEYIYYLLSEKQFRRLVQSVKPVVEPMSLCI